MHIVQLVTSRAILQRLVNVKEKFVNIVDSSNFLNNDVQSPIQQSEQNSVNNQMVFCGVINAWTEAGLSDNDD